MMYRYTQIANTLKQAIYENRFGGGERLPSIRKLSKQYEVSVSTALRCYEQLEAEGLIEARPQSGFFVRPIKASTYLQSESIPLQVTKPQRGNLIRQIQHSQREKSGIPLATAMLDASQMPIEQIQRSMWRVSRSFGRRCQSYGHELGEPELRRAITLWQQDSNLRQNEDELVVTNGCMEAISLAVRTCTPEGGVVAVPSPCYSGLLLMLESLGRKVLEIPATEHGPDLEALEVKIASESVDAIIVSANYQNPAGYSMPADKKRQLIRLLNHHKLACIEDDVFGDCGFTLQQEPPLKSYDTEGRVLYCHSFSKTLAPGYRIGWCNPGRYQASFLETKSALNVSTNVPLQLVIADFINCGELAKHRRKLSSFLSGQYSNIGQSIGKYFPQETQYSQVNGGLVVWVKLPEERCGTAVYERALQQGVHILPGSIFSNTNTYNHYIRLNLGYPWNTEVEAALQQLGKCV